MRLERKGRGRALRAAGARARRACRLPWTSTSRPTCARCMRSSRRCALGHKRSRDRHAAAHGARVVRGPKRELISRAYNRLLHTVTARATSPTPSAASKARCGAETLLGLMDDVTRTTAGSFDTRAARARPAARAAESTRCRSTGSTTPTRACDIVSTAADRPAAASRGLLCGRPGRALPGHRRRLDASPTPCSNLLLSGAARRGRRQRESHSP